MFPYAQTNIQLYRQLDAEGYPVADVETVARAHGVAMPLFPGIYRGSGRPFLAHLVGTASVLVSLRARVPVVVSGLLHAVYTHGEFGTGWRGINEAKRAKIRGEVGEEVEELIARYTQLTWRPGTVAAISARLDAMDPIERDVLLVRLANELEDHLDLGILYSADHAWRLGFMKKDLPATVDMAERLGAPALAKRLAEAFADVSSARVSPALRGSHGESFQVPLASHRPRLRVALSHLLARWLDRRPARRS
jgi:(p)ppGpp synthase/HD superfamily hydrolase